MAWPLPVVGIASEFSDTLRRGANEAHILITLVSELQKLVAFKEARDTHLVSCTFGGFYAHLGKKGFGLCIEVFRLHILHSRHHRIGDVFDLNKKLYTEACAGDLLSE